MQDIGEASCYHFDQMFGEDAFFDTLADVVKAYRGLS
jgi:hypothetical protein